MSYTPLTLAPSSWGFTFTSAGAGIEVTTPTNRPTVGQAWYGNDIGTYTLGPVDYIGSGGVETFSFAGVGNAVSGLITWLDVGDCDETPFMDGLLRLDTASGPIAADFPIDGTALIEATSLVSCPLRDLATCGGFEQSGFFGGRFIPYHPGIPTYVSEPSSFALLLAAVVLLILRSRRPRPKLSATY
jgi:hypothetical protein